MKLMKKILLQLVCVFVLLSFTLSTVFANATTFTNAYPLEVISENGIYYIEDPEYPMEYIVVYCMNNLLNWPHKMDDVDPPNYVYGYLEPDDIENYDEMIEKLERILYAGYPYNGKNLYRIIDDEELYVPSEDEFNDLLKPFPELVKAFPELGYNEITISNFENYEDMLSNFFEYVIFTMKDTDIREGLTKSAIMSMPFFKAALCLLNFSSPREAFANFFSTSYYVTEKQAFDNTQNAIWKLMNDYKVPYNNLNSLSSYPLGETLMNYANLNEVILDSEPEEEIILTGDFNFTQKQDGKWYSGKIKIEEPQGYNAIYMLHLPEGISVLNGNHWNIYGNTEFTLVSDNIPDVNDRFLIFCALMWGLELRQYSPEKEVTHNGKKYQNMTGLHVNTTPHIYSDFTYGDVVTGELIVNKTVNGNASDTIKDFNFTVNLSDNTINGTYGDMEFKDGIANFMLKHNESKTATGLPVGINYTVKESNNDGYIVESQNANGTISGNKISSVTFTNTNNSSNLTAGSLMVEKKVSGVASDTNKSFTFTVTLSDKTIDGTYGEMEFKNGIANFTLKHSESKTATGLPVGITYTVTESDNDGYKVESQNSNGTINSEQTSVATFINIKDSSELPIPSTGILSVEKIVLGDAGDTGQDFTFTVTLSDNTINGTYNQMTFVDGVSTFTLKHGQSKTAIGLPAGLTYTVTESNNDGYVVKSQNESGTITADKWITAFFLNKKSLPQLATGNLSLEKTVSGNAADTTQDFTFTVTLSDNTINGTYGDMEFKNGVATFTLKHNESKTANGLPEGITYTVTESDNDGYTVESQNANGSIIANQTVSASFNNTKNLPQLATGNLSVEKIVSGNAADTNKAFTFTVTLSDNTINGTYGDMEFINGVATFTLKHNENKTAIGLPEGITYTITESDNDGYTVESQNARGSIIANQTVSASFNNIKDLPQLATGNLSVEKIVSGNAADTNKAFTFTVTLSDNTINGTYGDMEFINGVATFTLKHNENKTAIGLPVGITYTVTESDNDGYTVESQNESGIISAEHTSVKFNNILSKAFEAPESGDNSNILLWFSICILSAISIIVSIILKYNKKS